MLISFAFALGGYTSFKLLLNQNEKQMNLIKDDESAIDQLRIKLRYTTTLLENSKRNARNILISQDEIFIKMFLEATNNPNIESLTLVAKAFEQYEKQKKEFL